MKSILLSILALTSFGLFAQTPILVKDINTIGNSSTPSQFYEFKGKLYFNATNFEDGRELWSYDDSKSIGNQIEQVANIYSGTNSSTPTNFTAFKDKLYFTARDRNNGVELFVYDGTNAPTVVADIVPGTSNSNPSNLTVFNNKLFFFADDGSNRELWVYDGINAPSIAYNLNASGSAFNNSSDLIVHNAKLYMSGTDGGNKGRSSIFVFDDMGGAPTLVANSEGSSGIASNNPGDLYSHNGDIYFTKTGLVNSSPVLWKYNMTTCSVVSENLTNLGSYTTFNNKLVFRAFENNIIGYELYEYDGTNAPKLYDIYPGNYRNSFPNSLTVHNGVLYFSATDGTNGNELYKYDGANAPSLVTDIYKGPKSSNITNTISYKGDLLFTAQDSFRLQDNEIMIYDGTNEPAYIKECAKINPGNLGSISSYNFDQIEYKGAYYFFANDGAFGYEVWKYDGTSTTLFADLEPGATSTNSGSFAILNGDLYIGTSSKLWKTDGTAAPTQIAPMQCKNLTTYKSKLYFNGYQSTTGEELWVYDGTNSPSIVADLVTGNGSTRPENLTVAGGILYFTIGLGNYKGKIISYNGTGTPTTLPTVDYSDASNLVALGNTLYFTATQFLFNQNRSRLFKVNGATAPSVAISNLYGCYNLAIYGNQLVYDGFILSGTTPGPTKIFRYAGSGTASEVDLGGATQMRNYTEAGNDLYFTASVPGGFEVWKYTGTGTPTKVTDLGTPQQSANPLNLHAFNGNLMFTAGAQNRGRELYTFCDIDLSTSIAGAKITANETGATYQWVDCDNGNSAISGETSQSFTATANGNYACIVNNRNCVSQTNCVAIKLNSSVNNSYKDILTLYPNPTKNTVIIKGFQEPILKVSVFNTSGQLIEIIENSNKLDLSKYSVGAYILLVESNSKMGHTKIVKIQ